MTGRDLRHFALAALVSCARGGRPSEDASVNGHLPDTNDLARIARAEDTRRAKDIAAEVRTSHDVTLRRRSARALARIADAQSVDGLVMHLSDDDAETVAWAAYGLGYACRGREDAHVRALAARSASLSPPLSAGPKGPVDSRGTVALDPRVAVARAIGRCAGPRSEQVLVSLLASRGPWTEPALLGLGDLATRKKHLGAEAIAALLDAAGDRTTPSGELAFYALARSEPNESFARRVHEAARLALGRPSAARILAIMALGRVGRATPADTAVELARVVTDVNAFAPGERAEAARALGGLGAAGQAAIADALAELTPDSKDPIAIAALTDARFHVLHTLLAALGPEAPRRAEPALSVLASLRPPTQPKPGLGRRIADLRCSAALALARGTYDAEVLEKCDAESSEISQRARLASILRVKVLGRERLGALRALAKSEHLRIREAAVEALGSHDTGDVGIAIVADALASKHAGLVATAAEMLNAHPERAMVLARSERRAALDPRSPPPTASPAQEVAPGVLHALSAALAEKWPEDRFETRIALLEAAAAIHYPRAAEIAQRACTDANPTVRERAQKAMRTLGMEAMACDTPDEEPKVAPELESPTRAATKVVLSTDSLQLAVVLDPELSPITTARVASLVRSGFYDGVAVHRVVPGFVVQLGDPEGDGYGGSGTSLRCETSPVPFDALDVGMALAGRDTGSSQFFVTLSRAPHLDGEYTRIGHAEGDWASVAQGDVITDARVVERNDAGASALP